MKQHFSNIRVGMLKISERHVALSIKITYTELRTQICFIKPYSPIYNINLDIHMVHIVIHNFAMGQGDIR